MIKFMYLNDGQFHIVNITNMSILCSSRVKIHSSKFISSVVYKNTCKKCHAVYLKYITKTKKTTNNKKILKETFLESTKMLYELRDKFSESTVINSKKFINNLLEKIEK